MQVLKVLLPLAMTLLSEPALSQEPVLTIRIADRESKLTRTDLVRVAGKITVNHDPVYRTKRDYIAISIQSLLKDLKPNPQSHIEFVANDGFASVLSLTRLIQNKSAEAYLAIETSQEPWPQIAGKNGSAGPFYLVWVESKGSDIRPEEWPYQVAQIRIIEDLKARYPKVFPSGSFSETHPVSKGLQVFMQNCFVCHTMNKQGASEMGPDLNTPYNPTEYLHERYLWKLVRDPQALRHWPQSQMPSFSTSVLSDQELKNLLAYLKHMSRNKQ